jgi:hypothetical protein
MCLGVKLTRHGFMMASLDCQPDWIKKHLEISECISSDN